MWFSPIRPSNRWPYPVVIVKAPWGVIWLRACGHHSGTTARMRKTHRKHIPCGPCPSLSGHDEIRNEDFSLGFRAEQQRNHKARRSDAGADQHRDRKAEIVMAGERGQHEGNKTAENRSLVI